MRGPAAPKDPVEKRPCLYVVLDKTISGSKDPEDVIRDYVYLEGRLKDQVKFTSGDIDEELLDMLPRMETFRKLAHCDAFFFTYFFYSHDNDILSYNSIYVQI